ncbi:hypothetical protein HNP24_001009 [Chryseobacterium sediminis]|uniref:Phage abortive infection protein n=1 Tax=Chryseobacterium sediminis TaxID=1679494 RepID=A0ABR6PWG1_9FLAO|nr:putative phage abortive infection protein [Chryseobacterium sediminis]MBB6330059.1 hypothetical protein [Chryseobacterium sediminis]
MKNGNWVFWTFGIGSVIFMGVTLYFNYNYAVKLGIERQGLFGDMFGASNALFTGLSFVGLILTILLQRQELKDTREEVKKQGDTLRNQRFDMSFFSLLNLHHDIVGKIETKKENKKNDQVISITVTSGRKVFNDAFAGLMTYIKDTDDYEYHYSKFHERSIYNFDHYFRNLYQIIKMIDDMIFSSDELDNFNEKYKYVSIVKGQLSQHELAMIFYNTIYSKGHKEFIPFITRYHLFSNANQDYILDKYKDFYSKEAYFE